MSNPNRRAMLLRLAGAAGLSLGLAGCVVAPVDPYPPIPPRRVEVMPPPPSREVIWQPGAYHWNGRGYDWIPGRYIKGPPGRRFVPGHWEQGPYQRRWVPAEWR